MLKHKKIYRLDPTNYRINNIKITNLVDQYLTDAINNSLLYDKYKIQFGGSIPLDFHRYDIPYCTFQLYIFFKILINYNISIYSLNKVIENNQHDFYAFLVYIKELVEK